VEDEVDVMHVLCDPAPGGWVRGTGRGAGCRYGVAMAQQSDRSPRRILPWSRRKPDTQAPAVDEPSPYTQGLLWENAFEAAQFFLVTASTMSADPDPEARVRADRDFQTAAERVEREPGFATEVLATTSSWVVQRVMEAHARRDYRLIDAVAYGGLVGEPSADLIIKRMVGLAVAESSGGHSLVVASRKAVADVRAEVASDPVRTVVALVAMSGWLAAREDGQ
jgi:hypothetical protein